VFSTKGRQKSISGARQQEMWLTLSLIQTQCSISAAPHGARNRLHDFPALTRLLRNS
jgi:hypothetical protein